MNALVWHPIECNVSLAEGVLKNWLVQTVDRAAMMVAPGFAGAGRNHALSAGIKAGIPVMLWSRTPCSDHANRHDGELCSGDQLLAELAHELNGVGLYELPERIRLLRAKAKYPPDDRALWRHSIVLLWDNASSRPWASAPLTLAR